MQTNNEQEQTPQGNSLSGDKIISGAGEEDQLDSFKATAADQNTGPKATQYGTQPSTGDDNADQDADKASVAGEQTGNTEGTDLGGTTNLSLDQLMEEGDNNN